MTTIEAKGLDSRLDTVRKLLDKANSTDSEHEAEQLTDKAAELMARYGITRAMLAESGKEKDPIVDRVIFCDRPYAENMADLLRAIARPLRAEVRSVKQFDPDDHGGRTKGAWHFGLRLFVHESDLLRIEMLYASLRNQAIKNMSRIKGNDKYAQDQRAHRISYLEGFTTAIWGRLENAEREAQAAQEAEQERLTELAMLEGHATPTSVELVLTGRNRAVKAAMDLALYGITPEERAARNMRMAEQSERWAEMDRAADARRAAHRAEHDTCPKCKAAKSGYCKDHADLRPLKGRQSYERVGAYWSDGYHDGQNAHLGDGKPVEGGRLAIDE